MRIKCTVRARPRLLRQKRFAIASLLKRSYGVDRPGDGVETFTSNLRCGVSESGKELGPP